MRIQYRSLAALLCSVQLTAVCFAQAPGRVEVEVLRADTAGPLAGVKVRLTDLDGTPVPAAEGVTGEDGKLTLSNLAPGSYRLILNHPKFGGETVTVKVEEGLAASYKTALEQSGDEATFTVRETREPQKELTQGDVVDVRADRDQEFIQRQIGEHTLQNVLSTAPGVQRNSMGQVHIRGEHRGVAYEVDGVQIPLPTTNQITQMIDPEFQQSIAVQNARTADTGSQSGTLVQTETIEPEKPFASYQVRVGNLGQYENILKAGTVSEDKNWSVFVGAHTQATDMYLDPPSPTDQTLNNYQRSNDYTLKVKGKTEQDKFGATVSYVHNNYGYPQTAANYNAGVRQDEADQNLLALFSWQRKLDTDSDLDLSLTYLRNTQRATSNGVFTAFNGFDPTVNPELAEEGLPANPRNAGSPYVPFYNLAISQIQPRLEYVRRFGERQRIKVGANADFISSDQSINITDPGGGGGLPGGGPSFNARLNRNGFLGGVFFSHTLPLGDDLTLNYGLRADRFSNGVGVDTGQLSPSANLVYKLNDSNSLRASYSRTFQAPPLELDVTGSSSVLPQRISTYELDYDVQFSDVVGSRLALVQRDFRDQVDVGLLVSGSNIPLFAPVNFSNAVYRGIEFTVNTRNPLGWNGFLTTTISEAKPYNTSPLDPGIPTYNDHDQRVQLTAGLSYKWENGLSAGADMFYGSGFPQEALSLYNAAGINPYGYSGARIPRVITNLNLNYMPKPSSDGPDIGGGLQILNLFDDRSLINFYSDFSGTRFVPQRRFLFNAQIKF